MNQSEFLSLIHVRLYFIENLRCRDFYFCRVKSLDCVCRVYIEETGVVIYRADRTCLWRGDHLSSIAFRNNRLQHQQPGFVVLHLFPYGKELFVCNIYARFSEIYGNPFRIWIIRVGRKTEKLNVSPMKGVVRPAAIGLMVMTGLRASWMIL